jgi:hypothetical protein
MSESISFCSDATDDDWVSVDGEPTRKRRIDKR